LIQTKEKERREVNLKLVVCKPLANTITSIPVNTKKTAPDIRARVFYTTLTNNNPLKHKKRKKRIQ
jgi:hypothetical protein